MENKILLGSPIQWPERFKPEHAPIHVRNECFIPASPAVVWAWLIRAESWPSWYSNSQDVEILAGEEAGSLTAEARFRWHTFGVCITSVVKEFVPGERIAWNAKGIGVDAYHAWVLFPADGGCHVLTEETQYGWGARAMNCLQPKRMYRRHGLWLNGLRIQSIKGMPTTGYAGER